MEKIAVIGGGFVGFQEAILFALHGYDVVVIDINPNVVESINSKKLDKLHIFEKFVVENWDKVKERISAYRDFKILRDLGIRDIIVAVNTPVKVYGEKLVSLLKSGFRKLDEYIDFKPLIDVAKNIAKYVEPPFYINSLVTIYPGGTWEKLAKYLVDQGFKLDKDFYLTHTPERVNPGSRKYHVGNIPRVIGGVSSKSVEYGIKLYERVGVKLYPVNKIEVAELSKIFENAWRFINIAFSQELYSKIDYAIEVIDASSTKPFGFIKFYPGPYIGGSCLLKDTIMYYCVTGSELARLSLLINEEFPRIYAEKLYMEIKSRNARNILFYGLGFKPNTPYYISRELNPVERVIQELKSIGRELVIKKYDPLIVEHSDFDEENKALNWADLVIYWENYQLKPRTPK